ncbi:MAG: elongation factor G [Candidatus Chloroheliales bacterium]|nr:MAG: elongation factor G [Chloroflexota bacterium]
MKSYTTEQLRNVGLFSHSGAGKTSLTEAILFNAKLISRVGRVDEGNTVSDYDPDEVKRRSSVNISLAPLEWKDCKINLLDIPGYADFVGEVKASMRVVDAALILVDAVGGVEVGTEQGWKFARERNLPTMVYINKMDRENASFEQVVSQVQAKFGKQVVPVQIPIGSSQAFRGVVDLWHMKAYMYAPSTGRAGDGKFEEVTIPADLQAQATQWREQLVERIAESSDELTMKYLEGEEIGDDEILHALHDGTKDCKLVPLLCGAGLSNIAVQPLLDAIVSYLPAPNETGAVKATNPTNGQTVTLNWKPDGPLAAFVFKTISDPYVGRISYIRVYSGTLRSDQTVTNANKGKDERVGQLHLMRGKEQENVQEVIAGDFAVINKLQDTGTGDTLCAQSQPLLLDGITYPTTLYSATVAPRTKADMDKMGTAIHRIVEEDPTIQVSRDAQTGETILSGMGDSHIAIIADRLQRKFGVAVDVSLPRVPYRETIKSRVAHAEYKHKKQTGGHGQYGHVVIELEPLHEGQDFEFTERVVGGSVPRNFYPAVEKGVHEALGEGVLAGYPVTGVRVTLIDGSYHPVDSSEMAFKIAANQAFKKGVMEGKPILLEPIYEMEITVPDDYAGDVMSDLNTKRARVHGMDQEGSGNTVITAAAPLAEIQSYSADLRSITQGRGTYTMHFERYEEAPSNVTAKVVEAHKAAVAAAEH